MSDLLIRLAILALAVLLTVAIVWLGRGFVERQRRLALAASPLKDTKSTQRTRILAFSSEGCTQCHTLQLPALQRLQELRGPEIEIVDVDASSSPELVKRYRVMTVPSTVILNAAGEVHAVNYGFANFGKLRQQTDALV
jgi:thioredoxin-related protein